MRKIYFSILFIFTSVCSYAQTDSIQISEIAQMPEAVVTKAQADSAYINNDFASAAYLYENILANQGESADIYYNLGNSYYKMDNIAKAIVNYEKALVLNPSDGDIRFNLELAQSKTVDKITPMNSTARSSNRSKTAKRMKPSAPARKPSARKNKPPKKTA